MTKKYYPKFTLSNRSVLSTEPQTFDFIFIGNERPVKGLDILMDILSRCIGQYRVAVIGYLPKVTDLFKGTRGFKFFGELHGNEKATVLMKSMILFLTSYHESFSIVICEALHLGVPVVAFDMPTLRSVYKGGVKFVKYKDTDAMWEQMKELLHDGDMMNKMTTEAFKEGQRFSWKEGAKKVLE